MRQFEIDSQRLEAVKQGLKNLVKGQALGRMEIFPFSKGKNHWQYKLLADLVTVGCLNRQGAAHSAHQKYMAVGGELEKLLEDPNGVKHLLWPSTKNEPSLEPIEDEMNLTLEEDEEDEEDEENESSGATETQDLLRTFTEQMGKFCAVLERFDGRLNKIDDRLTALNLKIEAPTAGPVAVPDDALNKAISNMQQTIALTNVAATTTQRAVGKLDQSLAEQLKNIESEQIINFRGIGILTQLLIGLGEELGFTLLSETDKNKTTIISMPNIGLLSGIKHQSKDKK